MAASMNMDDRQIHQVASLPALNAAVFGLGDDRPILVRVPYMKVPSQSSKIRSSIGLQETVQDATRFQQWAITTWNNRRIRLALKSHILAFLSGSYEYQAFQEESMKLVASSIGEHPEAWLELARLGISRTIDELGTKFDRPFIEIQKIEELSIKMLSSENGNIKNVNLIRNAFSDLCRLHHYPYSGCELVCPDKVCFFGYSFYEEARKREIRSLLRLAGTQNNGDRLWEEMMKIGLNATDKNLPRRITKDARIRATICLIIQAVNEMVDLNEEHKIKITRNIRSVLESSIR
jgi:hypothetical protein